MTVRTLGTAGHVDHGKTALVRALTGTDTDRLPEERRRGISIELGYARLDLGATVLSVIDVPGHERFVRTMVAGATGIDLALLCVACDDGVMPQTREHLAILDLLGVRHGVVALTKADLVDADGAAVAAAEVRDLLAGSGLADAPVVPVSARSGAGLAGLEAALRRVALRTPARPSGGAARLPVDRVLSPPGIGTVVTGTLWSGRLVPGARATLLPSGRTVRVRSLGAHGAPVPAAEAGGRVAVALAGAGRADVRRGDWLVTDPEPPRSYRLDVTLRALPGGPGLRHGERVEVLHGTAAAAARVVLLDVQGLAPGAATAAQLRLAGPVAARRGDRVVLRRTGPALTVAGGVVLDPAPPRHAGGPVARDRLDVLAGGDDDAVLAAAVADVPARPADVVARGLLDPAGAQAAAARLLAAGAVVELDGGALLGTGGYRRLAEAVREALAAQARRDPVAASLPVAAVLPTVPDGPLRAALVARLAADGVLERHGEAGVAALAPPALDAGGRPAVLAARLLAALAARPFAPPRLDAALEALDAPRAEARRLAALLERQGRLVRLADGLAVTGEAYAEARRLVVAACARSGGVTPGELRDATEGSRRTATALLERLDAEGVTRRAGDRHVLRAPSTAPPALTSGCAPPWRR